MELKNDFVVDRPVGETWNILTNLELIAPCLPGARLEEVEGDEYRGSVSVKVGPITGKYKGKASFVEQDAANHVARLRAEGRDPRQGNANALITAAMVPAGADGSQTRVDLTTDLGLSGKIASFARGNLEDVSRKLLTQFAQNLETMLAEQGSSVGAGTSSAAGTANGGAAVPSDVVPAPDTATGAATATTAGGTGADLPTGAAASPGAAATDAGLGPVTSGVGGGHEPGTITQPGGSDRAPAATPATPATAVESAPPTVRKINSPEAQPIDLLAVGGADTISKKLAPVVGVLVLLLLIRWFLRRRND